MRSSLRQSSFAKTISAPFDEDLKVWRIAMGADEGVVLKTWVVDHSPCLFEGCRIDDGTDVGAEEPC